MTADERIPVGEWTDDEWLWALVEYPPDTDIEKAERAVARRRSRSFVPWEEVKAKRRAQGL